MSEAARVRSTPRFAIEAPAFAAVGVMNTLIDGVVFAFLVGVLGIANGGAAASVASAVA